MTLLKMSAHLCSSPHAPTCKESTIFLRVVNEGGLIELRTHDVKFQASISGDILDGVFIDKNAYARSAGIAPCSKVG